MKTLTAVLFAGGESRRMGTDKATLVLKGEPLWARQLRILRELRAEKIMVSARSRPAWCDKDVEVVLDIPPSRGPLSGLATALRTIQTTHLLTLAVDLPKMTSAHLKKLWALSRRGIGVIPQNGETLEPLCAIYPVESMSVAQKALLDKDVSLRGFIRALIAQGRIDLYPVAKSHASIYRNINTAEQWQRACVPEH